MKRFAHQGKAPDAKDWYKPAQAVYAIHQQHARAATQADFDRYQLDLLYHHLPAMDTETTERARKTIRAIEARLVSGVAA